MRRTWHGASRTPSPQTNQNGLSRRTSVNRFTFDGTVKGNAWPDVVTVMLLEYAPDIDLWPAHSQRRGA